MTSIESVGLFRGYVGLQIDQKELWVCPDETPFASLTNQAAKSTIGSCDGITLPMDLREPIGR
jgi:hypothetical protein